MDYSNIMKTNEQMNQMMEERQLCSKWRKAIQHCKNKLEIRYVQDFALEEEQRTAFEKCLTKDFLLKYGLNYFGNRDFLFIDLYGEDNASVMRS